MLASLAGQTRRPDQVIVVDASVEPVERIVQSIGGLAAEYVRWTGKPSAAAQRNAGLTKVREDIGLVCFFDDDQILHPDGIEKMLAFWGTAGAEVGGASFNMGNHEDKRCGRLKKSRLTDALGLYCREPGRVARSGWQSLYGKVTQNTEVEWVGSGASVWRRDVLAQFRFDPFFDGYSYLEDLDFSYGVSRTCKLVVVADAMFEHYHSRAGKNSRYSFGELEVRNRLYFVNKHDLSLPRCYAGLALRVLMNLALIAKRRELGLLSNLAGNLVGVMRGIVQRSYVKRS